MNSRTPRHRVTTLLLLAVFTSMMLIAPSASAQGNSGRNVNQSASVLMSGTTAAGDAFTGVFRIANFAVQNGQIVAQGTLTGTLTNATSGATQSVTQAISAPLVGASASCQILSLTLGPLDLNLLGLQVHLNQVVLNITAQPGPGNLLGNLLCAVANLLNGGGGLSTLLTQLTNLLNQILGAL